MKVLWITSVYPSDKQPGAGVFHETQVQALTRLGIEVTVICPVPRNPKLLEFVKKQYRVHHGIPNMYRRNGVTVFRPPYLALPGQLRWAQPDQRIATAVLETMSDYRIEPDLIHAHFAMPSGGAARIVAEQINRPWILTLHGSDVNIYPYFSASAKKAFQRSVTKANHVLAVGDSLKTKAKELTGRESVVLPIGVDLSVFHQVEDSKGEQRKRLQLPENKRLVVFVGRLTKAKGVFELAQALERLSDEIAVLFVGDGSAKEKLKQHPDFNRRLFLTGQVENHRVKDYLLASDVLALPSYTEGMPTVVIEALAAKIPVICTAVGGVPDLFGEYRHLLIEKESVADLVERINDVLYGNLYTTSIREELFERIQAHYHIDHNALLLKKEYSRTLETKTE
ncbi:teichuronic acid biosynthesis protein TuaC [Neobacillus mesonae]|uniref:teichuronic acid biosynthesis protein TuaC n=1 Tax=Neobacillus mesonae TaxID=1193713 RepID=UPI002572F605|nr:glycosyltransferase [Neobacillus mesonae]